MEDRLEKTAPVSEPLDSVLDRLKRAGDAVIERKSKFSNWFTELDPPSVKCRHHGTVLVPDFEASWLASSRTDQNKVIHETCPHCAEAEARLARSNWLVRRGVPEVLKYSALDGYIPETQEEIETQAACCRWSSAPCGFLLLHGKIGTGKSHLLAAIIRAAGFGRYRTHEQIVRELRGGYGSEHSNLISKEEFEKTKTCRLLCWDEFGLGGSGADVPEMIHSILCHRYENHLPTAIAFNGPLAPFKALIGDRMESRIREAMFGEPLLFSGRDRRAGRNQIYQQQKQTP